MLLLFNFRLFLGYFILKISGGSPNLLTSLKEIRIKKGIEFEEAKETHVVLHKILFKRRFNQGNLALIHKFLDIRFGDLLPVFVEIPKSLNGFFFKILMQRETAIPQDEQAEVVVQRRRMVSLGNVA